MMKHKTTIFHNFLRRMQRPKKAEIYRLSERYCNMILDNKAVKLITGEDFGNFIKVAKYADFGKSTAIQAAFCMGYDVRKVVR